MPQCVVTPHLGASTFEAQDKVGLAIAEEVINVLGGKMVPNAVNLPAIAATELEDLRGYLALGDALGKLYYQLKKHRWTGWRLFMKGPRPSRRRRW